MDGGDGGGGEGDGVGEMREMMKRSKTALHGPMQCHNIIIEWWHHSLLSVDINSKVTLCSINGRSNMCIYN